MKEVNLLDTSAEVDRIIHLLEQARDATSEMIPGWRIRRPILGEFDSLFGVVFAESNGESNEPLVLPRTDDVCVAVIDGTVKIDGLDRILSGHSLHVIRAVDSASAWALTHPSRLALVFFKTPALSGERAA